MWRGSFVLGATNFAAECDGLLAVLDERWPEARDALRASIDAGGKSCTVICLLGVALVHLGDVATGQRIRDGEPQGQARRCRNPSCAERRLLDHAIAAARGR
jgi:hypothetical protein